jgi:hypothetical protein
MADQDVARLPKWAQEKIRILQMQLEAVTKNRDELIAGINDGEPSSIYVKGWQTKPHLYLPEDSTVVFKMDNRQEIAVVFRSGRYDFERDSIVVRSNWHAMSIRPEAANAVSISAEER